MELISSVDDLPFGETGEGGGGGAMDVELTAKLAVVIAPAQALPHFLAPPNWPELA